MPATVPTFQHWIGDPSQCNKSRKKMRREDQKGRK